MNHDQPRDSSSDGHECKGGGDVTTCSLPALLTDLSSGSVTLRSTVWRSETLHWSSKGVHGARREPSPRSVLPRPDEMHFRFHRRQQNVLMTVNPFGTLSELTFLNKKNKKSGAISAERTSWQESFIFPICTLRFRWGDVFFFFKFGVLRVTWHQPDIFYFTIFSSLCVFVYAHCRIITIVLAES